jgi:hypothetical protein
MGKVCLLGSSLRALLTCGTDSQLSQFDEEALNYCSPLKFIVIPVMVRLLRRAGFSICWSLCSVDFASGSKLQPIGFDAFSECTDLEPLSLPVSIIGF